MPNFLIIAHGRGSTFCGMANMDLQQLANEMQYTINQGFEVYIYSLQASPAGLNVHFPKGVLPIKREFHLWNASDEFLDDARSIIRKLDGHSTIASHDYLTQAISILQEADNELRRNVSDVVKSVVEDKSTKVNNSGKDVQPTEPGSSEVSPAGGQTPNAP